MKKILLPLILSVVMLITLCLPASAATGKLSGTATVGKNGTSFTIDLILSDNPGVIAISSLAEYDSKVLKLTSAENGEIFDGTYVQSQYITVNPYTMIWMEATAPKNITTNGVLARYTFEVLDTAAIGETEIKFSIDDVVNFEKDNSASFTGCSFKVNISGVSASTPTENSASEKEGESNATDSASKIANTQTLVVEKPQASTTSNSSDTDTSSATDTNNSTISEIEDEPENEEENNARTLTTIISIAGVLVVGAAITLIALYFRNKSAKTEE